MISFTFEDGLRVALHAIPISVGNEYFPSGSRWGEKVSIEGSILVDNQIDSADLLTKIILKDKLDGIDELTEIKKRGCRAVVTCEQRLLDVNTFEGLPYIIYLPPTHRDMFTQREGERGTIEIDLSMFTKKVWEDQFTLVYSKGEPNYLINRIVTVTQQIRQLYHVHFPRLFTFYYFEDQNQQKALSYIKESFAYRNKYVGMVFKSGNYGAEAHELTHLALYQVGDPVFLFLEGLATLTYDLCTIPNHKEKFLANIMARNLKRKNSLVPLDHLVKPVQSFKQYDSNCYFTAASFLSWLYTKVGMESLLACYRMMSKQNSLLENKAIFERIIGFELEKGELEWHKELEQVIIQQEKQSIRKREIP